MPRQQRLVLSVEPLEETVEALADQVARGMLAGTTSREDAEKAIVKAKKVSRARAGELVAAALAREKAAARERAKRPAPAERAKLEHVPPARFAALRDELGMTNKMCAAASKAAGAGEHAEPDDRAHLVEGRELRDVRPGRGRLAVLGRVPVNDDDDDEQPPPCFDGRGVLVMRERCRTCIFRPGNPMRLNRGRLADMTETTDRLDTNVICHQTLGQPVGALCRGSVDRRPGQMVQIAERLGVLVEV